MATLDWEELPDAWALKPNYGQQGAGILLVTEKDGEGWWTASGHHLPRRRIENHLRFVLDGEFSLDCLVQNWAFFEPPISAHLAELVPVGLPDMRLICHRDRVLLGMIRLPTRESGRRANLHQGAIGAAVDLTSGRTTRALSGDDVVGKHRTRATSSWELRSHTGRKSLR